MNSQTLNYNITNLFYFKEFNNEQANLYYRNFDKDNNCNIIDEFREKLIDRYNVEMIFLTIPCKDTIYNKIADQIPVFKLSGDIVNSENVLYCDTNMNWYQNDPDHAISNYF